MVEGEDVASDGLLGLSSVCGEQRVYGRDVIRAVGNLRHSGVQVVQSREVICSVVDVMSETLRHCVFYVGAWAREFGGRGSVYNSRWVSGGAEREVLQYDLAKWVPDSREEGVQLVDEWCVWRGSRATGGAIVQAQGVERGRGGSSGGDLVIADGGAERGW